MYKLESNKIWDQKITNEITIDWRKITKHEFGSKLKIAFGVWFLLGMIRDDSYK